MKRIVLSLVAATLTTVAAAQISDGENFYSLGEWEQAEYYLQKAVADSPGSAANTLP